MRAAAIMQLTFFLVLFLTEAQTPLNVMQGWLEQVARINPFTNVLRLARLGFVDADVAWSNIWGGAARPRRLRLPLALVRRLAA